VRDGRWRQGFLRFARRSGAPVLPVRIEARNSALFYGTSVLFKPAATALLAREMYARRGRPLALRIGTALPVGDGDPALALRRVRKALYALGRREGSPRAVEVPVASPLDRQRLVAAVEAAELLGETADGKQIRLAQADAGSPLLHEIGRLRELTFRKVGEGTGRSLDLDHYDPHYQHVLVWDAQAQQIAGAYRIARGARMLARNGLEGLYTASLFRYADDAVPRLAQGLELGRSFVAPAYWAGRSLDVIRTYVTCMARYRSARRCRWLRASSWSPTTSGTTAASVRSRNRCDHSNTSPRRRHSAGWMPTPRTAC
jgi:hypothetical protein